MPKKKFVKVEYKATHLLFTKEELKQIQENRVNYSERCPFCGSTSFDGEGVEIDCNEASQDVSCGECSAAWRDWYKFDMLQVT
jgi:hypothetical protein